MKRLGVFLLLFEMVLSANVSAKEPLKLVYPDYPPYVWEEIGRAKGLLVDIFDEALKKRMGIEYIYEKVPFKRGQFWVKKGMRDGFVSTLSEDRNTYANSSKESLTVVKVVAFTKVDHPRLNEMKQIKRFEDLQNYTVQSFLGHGWKGRLEKAGVKINWSNDVETTFKMIATGRADIFVDTLEPNLFKLKKWKMQDKVMALPVFFAEVPFILYIGKKSHYATMLGQFDDTMKEMKEDGTLQRIYDKYK